MECVEEFIDTPDGWRLATYRYPQKSSKKFPVILVHGMGTNRFDLDFVVPRLSLAQYLHCHGYDVWVIELRGVGKSHKKNWVDRCVSNLRFDWTFDDYLYKDLPALVSHIQRRTRSQKIHWVGHSLGGTLIYTAIETMGETMGNSPFASVVTLGSAMSASAKHGLIHLLLKIDPLVKKMPLLPLKHLAKWSAPVSRWVAPIEDNFFYSADNTDMEVIKLALETTVENVSPALFLQLHDWYKNNHFRSLSGFSFRDHLKKIKVPVFVCAGSVDGLTAYPDVHFAYRQIASRDKKFQLFGREQGHRTEYGHMDLALGKNAPKEVFPEIVKWFEKHNKK